MKKFWVVHNIPSPYRLHIFNALWKECQKRDLDFHVHFMSDMSHGYEERPLSWRNPKMEFPYTYWRDYGRGQRHVNPGLLWHLRKNKPDYLLSGSPFDTLTGMFAGRMTNGVACTWVEGNTRNPGKIGGIIGLIKRFALSGYRYVAVPGVQGERYIALHQALTRWKMPKCILLPNLVNEALFDVSRLRAMRMQDVGPAFEMRERFGCKKEERLCIVPSRLDPVKGVLEFLSCVTPEMLRGWRVVIAGNGPLYDDAQRIIRDKGIADRVVINGFVKYEDMPALYAASDLLLLPSLRDQNPLAIVEGLHAGLTIAESDQAGNVEEAVTEGKNGWVLPVKDKDAFVGKLRTIFDTPIEHLSEMGRCSQEENAKYWNSRDAIRAFIDALIDG